jgi:hypothetical protein
MVQIPTKSKIRSVYRRVASTEAESKEKHGARGPMPELTITSPYVHSRIDSKTFTTGNSIPESTLTLCQSRLYPPNQGLRNLASVEI